VIIPWETFEELSRYVDTEILNEITTYIMGMEKIIAVGPMRFHKPTIVTRDKVLHRLRSSLRKILDYVENELQKTLKKLKEKN